MKILLLSISLLVSNLKPNSYPCHPNGDVFPCTHPAHVLGDVGPCLHFNYYGNRIHANDLYPCVHPMHNGDVFPCQHICY